MSRDLPDYKSSRQVLNGISLAYSSMYNPRGLECLWNSPYCHTLNELLRPYKDGQFLVFSPYTIWMPALVKMEEELRSDFEKVSLDFDGPHPALPNEDYLYDTAKEIMGEPEENPPSVIKAGPSGPRQSERNKKKAKAASDTACIRIGLQIEIGHLLQRRTTLMEEKAKVAEKMQESLDQDVNDVSIALMSDATAFERMPDIYVAHVGAVRISRPHSKDLEERYKLRSERKIYHLCGAVLVELKQGPSRILTGKDYPSKALNIIDVAKKELLEYSSAYFARHPETESVLAIAVSGPFWTWANILPENTPKWDFILNRADKDSEEGKPLVRKWRGLFKRCMLRLGSMESDAEWTKISKDHIYPLHSHAAVPLHLLAVREDSEDDKDGEQDEE